MLQEAFDERNPLLERLKFLAIFSSNLDEFFQKRMGILRPPPEDQSLAATERRELFARKRELIVSMLAQQAACYEEELRPQLATNGIHLVDWAGLNDAQREEASAQFRSEVLPVLTPLSLDAAHPFPYVSNLSTSWAFNLEDPVSGGLVLVRVKVPSELPQWLRVRASVGAGERVFVGLDQVIRANAEALFPGMLVGSASLFRVCRDAEVEVDEAEAASKRRMVEEELRQRRFEPVVRLEVQPDAEPSMVAELEGRFGLTPDDVYAMPALLDYTTLFEVAGLEVESLRDPPWTPLPPIDLEPGQGDIFTAIRSGDILLHHPYDSFNASVERFIREAADDPLTVSIKMTVYRVGDDTPFVQSLIRAAEAGKQVACVIELNARFDEERNIHWSRELESVGAHVVFGVSGLKTHSKTALVVRKEETGMRSYAHIATGNYHTRTAKLYEDIGLLTTDPRITGCRHPVQLPHGAFPDAGVRRACGGTDPHALAVRRADRTRDRQPRGRPAGADRVQDEPARGPRDVRAAVAGLGGRGADPADRSRAVLSAPRRPRADRERHHPVDRRALPRALPHLSLRRWLG